MLYEFSNCRVDDGSRTLLREGKQVTVEPKAFDLLLHLLRNCGRAVARQELLETVWSGVKVSDTAVNRCVMVARQAIGDDDPDNRIISTVHGRGFRLSASVRVADLSGTLWMDTPAIPGAAVPLPPPTGPFAGRSVELQRLRAAWQEVLHGNQGRAMLVAGEPGIGKSRLALEAAVDAQAGGALILLGSCDADLAVPFQPFLEALAGFLRWCPVQSLSSMLGRQSGELRRLAPELAHLNPSAPAPVHADAETERYRLFLAVASWINEVAENVPIVLIIDDLHWATRDTALLFRHLLRSIRNSRVFVIATYRDTDLEPSRPFWDVYADIQRETHLDRVRLEGLDVESVGTLLRTAGGSRDIPQLAQRVREYSNGNALFVSEIIRHFRERDERLPDHRDPEWNLLPMSVRATVLRRVRGLPETAQEVIGWASVLGRDFSSRLVESLCGRTSSDVDFGLDLACQARILEFSPHGNFRFTHGLLRDALYEELGPAVRTAKHRRIAATLETIFADDLESHLSTIAFHHVQAATDDCTRPAIDASIRAGDQARQALAHEQAALHYAAALRLLPAGSTPSKEEVDTWIKLAEAQRDAESVAFGESATTALARARQLDDPGLLARAESLQIGSSTPPERSGDPRRAGRKT